MIKLLKLRLFKVANASLYAWLAIFIIGNLMYGWNSEPMSHSEVLFDSVMNKWLGFTIGVYIGACISVLNDLDSIINKYKNDGFNIQSNMSEEVLDSIAKRVVELQKEEL